MAVRLRAPGGWASLTCLPHVAYRCLVLCVCFGDREVELLRLVLLPEIRMRHMKYERQPVLPPCSNGLRRIL